jgi:heme/copper-type cytochrome/quinol oxidase subunit 3
MLNLIASTFFIFLATYDHIIRHDETSFIHWMLWAIICGIGFLIGEKLNERNKR